MSMPTHFSSPAAGRLGCIRGHRPALKYIASRLSISDLVTIEPDSPQLKDRKDKEIKKANWELAKPPPLPWLRKKAGRDPAGW
jgi:hypothetical protein